MINENFQLLVNSQYGIYSRQTLAEMLKDKFENGKVFGINPDDFQTLLNGADDEFYFDVDVANITFEGDDGIVYSIYESEDIWCYPEHLHNEIEWDEWV